MDLSLVIPLLNEKESLEELTEWISKVCRDNGYTFEIILVDDGSTDGSWDEILRLQKLNESVRGLKFRRNYGKSAALHCGFEESKGAVVITMDADLQDNPDEIPEMYNLIAKEGYDLVSGWKKVRHDPKLAKNIPSKLYNWTARKVTGIKLHDFNCGFKAYRQQVIKSIEVYGEMHRYMPVLAKQAGFINIVEKVVLHRKRKHGKSKFGMERFVNGFLDLMTITFISRFGKRPMHFFGTLGILMFFAGFLAVAVLGGQKLYYVFQEMAYQRVTQSPYFYISLAMMIIGTQLFLAGFLGELVSRSATDRNKYQIDGKI